MTTPATLVTLTIDDRQVSVPQGTVVIRAAEQLGIHIPRFCDHPLLKPVGACRQCVVDVGTPGPDGSIRWMPKPQSSCTTVVSEGMTVKTQAMSETISKAQHGVMELLLINHPLDCPVCDKGGECPLQNQAMSDGRATSRFRDVKRTWPKPINITTQILLDRERCILCQRCTRFAAEIAGDPFVALQQRGARQEIGRFDPAVLGIAGTDDEVGPYVDHSGRPFASYFSGNIIQICPVGALTSAAYRFRSRPFDLRSVESVSEHDSSGAAIRVDVRREVVLRRLAGNDPTVNEEWITDKDRFAFRWQSAPDRLTTPLIRVAGPHGQSELIPASWPVAMQAVAKGLAGTRAGVLTGGRIPLEDAYAYAKFARVVLGTNDIDFRARASSAAETAFLGAHVAARPGVSFAELEAAPQVLLAGFEAEEEGGIVFVRLRKAAAHGTRVASIAPFASRGLTRLAGTLLPAAPGGEAAVLAALLSASPQSGADAAPGADAQSGADAQTAVAQGLAQPGAVIIVGERLATSAGALAAAVALARHTGARLAWIPRRAGERGALEAGALPTLLPGGRPVADDAARQQVQSVWGTVPTAPGRDGAAMWAAAAAGELDALVVSGVELADQVDQDLVRQGAARAFVVSLEVRSSEITELADVVLPVAPPAERGGTFVNWEGRRRPFGQALTTTALPEHRVIDMMAAALGTTLHTRTMAQIHAELDQFQPWQGDRAADIVAAAPGASAPPAGQVTLATWRFLLDNARGQDCEQFLAATAKQPIARTSAATAAAVGASEAVTVSTAQGSITVPLVITDMVDDVVWLPANSGHCRVLRELGVGAGAPVHLAAATLTSATTTQEVSA